MVDVAKESVESMFHGHTTVGTGAVQLSNLNFPLLKGVLLRTPGGDDPVPNTAPVWVGGRSVTADSSASGGLPLVPGSSVFIPIELLTGVYVVSSDSDQDVAWVAS